MSLRVAIQMDAPESFRPQTDSTILLALEAQKRGHTLWHYHPNQLSLVNGVPTAARARQITFFDRDENFFEQGTPETLSLAEMNIVLMRQDPPFDMNYLTATYLLECLPPNVRVFNPPAAVRDNPEKLSMFHFPEYIPPTLISRDEDAIRAFHREQGEVVIKPLYGFGGQSIFHIARDGHNLSALLGLFFSTSPDPLVVQRFLPEVKSEDRRLIIINGEVKATLGRIPQAGEVRANMAAGGKGVTAEITPRQQEIGEVVGAFLKARGIVFAGIDLIGDYLTEINITSPTGLKAIKRLYGIDLTPHIWDAMEQSI